MNTKFEEFKELTNYDMIDTYYDEIKDFKYFISNLQEDRVESQKYIVNANEEITRLNNIINELEKWLLLEISIHCEDDTIDTLYNGVLDKLKEIKERNNERV